MLLVFSSSSSEKSADQALIADAPTLNARARLAGRDDWAIKSAIGAYKRHVVGRGITPRAAAIDPATGELRVDFNNRADALFRTWSRDPTLCDQERKTTFVGLQRLLIAEFVTVGMAMEIQNYTRRAEGVGLTLQVFEPEQLARDRDKDPTTGNAIRHGIEIDKYGAPVAFHIGTSEHPLETSSM